MIFAFVVVSAIALHWGMERILDGVGGSAYTRTAIEAVELFIFAVNLVCVVAFIVKEAWVLLKLLLTDPGPPGAA